MWCLTLPAAGVGSECATVGHYGLPTLHDQRRVTIRRYGRNVLCLNFDRLYSSGSNWKPVSLLQTVFEGLAQPRTRPHKRGR